MKIIIHTVSLLLLLVGMPSYAGEKEDLEGLRNTTLNLIDALVKEGILSQEKAADLIKQVESKPTPATAVTPLPVDSKVVRVPYVPEIIKNEIREQIKQEVLAQAKSERWGTPGLLPEWIERITWEGDLRLRYERDMFDDENAPFQNFQALVNNVGKVVLIAPSAVTHANDMHQRLIELPILTRNTVSGKITVKTPLTANLAPPGYYMLFLVNLGNVLPNQPRQVPSVAKWLRIGPSSVQFNAAGYGVSESMTAFTVRATRTGKIDKALTVQYATRDVTTGNRAQANVDYMPASGTLTFPAGSATTRSFVVTLLNDTTDEPDERFEVLLSTITVTPPAAPNDPIIGAPTPVFFTIRDDD